MKRKSRDDDVYASLPSGPPLDTTVPTTRTTSSSSTTSLGATSDDRLREAEEARVRADEARARAEADMEAETRRQHRAATIAILNELLALLHVCGVGYMYLCQYKCHEAISAFGQLETEQYETGWTMSKIGRAHFELVEYNEVMYHSDGH